LFLLKILAGARRLLSRQHRTYNCVSFRRMQTTNNTQMPAYRPYKNASFGGLLAKSLLFIV